jgi:hypothetical protein
MAYREKLEQAQATQKKKRECVPPPRLACLFPRDIGAPHLLAPPPFVRSMLRRSLVLAATTIAEKLEEKKRKQAEEAEEEKKRKKRKVGPPPAPLSPTKVAAHLLSCCSPLWTRQKEGKEKDLLRVPMVLTLPGTAWETQRAPFGKYTHAMPPFPFVAETAWGLTPSVDARVRDLCRPVHQHYCLKDRRGVMVSYMRYKRLGPKALIRMREWVVRCKKRR